MKYVFTPLLAVVALALVAAPATADWNPNDFQKWVQLPDPDGFDVMFTADPDGVWYVPLADDFPCYETGQITDVHIWFSVAGDLFDPREVVEKFHLSIHENIPADPTGGEFPWSRPGKLLWEGDFPYDDETVTIRRYGTGNQRFLFPHPTFPDEAWDHHQTWQANILIDPDGPDGAFTQEGTSTDPKIYWLDASVTVIPGSTAELGWKTSERRWFPEPGVRDDDAVFWYDDPFGAGPPAGWYEIKDQAGNSLNLAFVITPEPGTVVMLLGAGLIGLVAYARRRRKS